MIKKCYVLNGEIINIGEWDYSKDQVVISQAEYDEEGNVTKEAVFEEVIKNPLPVGTLEEERDFEYNEERGWFEKGKPLKPNEIEILQSKLNSATQQLDFQEELIVEMAMMIYQ